MADKVIIPLAGVGTLVLAADDYVSALAEGAKLSAAPAVPAEPLLDADQLATALNLPVTWVEQAAREGRIPSIQAGRWRRFRRSAVESALAAQK